MLGFYYKFVDMHFAVLDDGSVYKSSPMGFEKWPSLDGGLMNCKDSDSDEFVNSIPDQGQQSLVAEFKLKLSA
jgi:hypothetical protein